MSEDYTTSLTALAKAGHEDIRVEYPEFKQVVTKFGERGILKGIYEGKRVCLFMTKKQMSLLSENKPHVAKAIEISLHLKKSGFEYAEIVAFRYE